MGVSTLYKEEETIEDCDKTLFDWLKENDVEQVGSLLQTKTIDVNEKDAEVRIVKITNIGVTFLARWSFVMMFPS